jgi:hypothetical protein
LTSPPPRATEVPRAGAHWPVERLPSWVARQLERGGACIVACPIAGEGIAGSVASVVDPSNDAGYKNVRNVKGQPPEESLRSVRRLASAEQPLKDAFAQSLADLGLQVGRKDVRREQPHEITDGITAVRAQRDCPRQYDHCDRAGEASLHGKPLAQVPLVALLAIENDTRIVINGVEIALANYEMIIFRGDLCHAGAAYSRCHTRLHAYMDPVSLRVNHSLHGCRE